MTNASVLADKFKLLVLTPFCNDELVLQQLSALGIGGF
jgi:hypothetical protein